MFLLVFRHNRPHLHLSYLTRLLRRNSPTRLFRWCQTVWALLDPSQNGMHQLKIGRVGVQRSGCVFVYNSDRR